MKTKDEAVKASKEATELPTKEKWLTVVSDYIDFVCSQGENQIQVTIFDYDIFCSVGAELICLGYSVHFSADKRVLTIIWLDNYLIKATYRFPNGNVATFGYDDQQIGELQGVYSEDLLRKIKCRADENTQYHGF